VIRENGKNRSNAWIFRRKRRRRQNPAGSFRCRRQNPRRPIHSQSPTPNEFCITGSKRREDGRVGQIEHGIESDPLTCESTSGFDFADTTGPPGRLRKPANLLSAR